MAKNLRKLHPESAVTEPRIAGLRDECRRQSESCEYTAASLYVWQKKARFWRAVFLVAPIVFGGIAGSQILGLLGKQWGPLIGLTCGLLAGFFPAIYVALNMDMKVQEIGRAASEFTSLRDRFRQAAEITALSSDSELQTAFEGLMDRMDAARASAPPAPERCFEEARRKIKKGHYEFQVDQGSQAASSTAAGIKTN
jgi:hypothetical protein